MATAASRRSWAAKIFFPKVIAPRFFKQEPNLAEIQKVVDNELPPMFDYLEGEIGNKELLVGNKFSIADIGIATQFVNLMLRDTASMRSDGRSWPPTSTGSIAGRRSRAAIDKEKAAFGA